MRERARAHFARALAAGAVAVALGMTLAACGPAAPEPTSEPTGVVESPSDTPSPTPEAAELIPGGTAEQNKPYFDQVIRAYRASDGKQTGAAYVDNLVDAGFERSDIEVTPDKTPAGIDADSIMIGVKFGETCLIGQVGVAGDFYRSVPEPVLGTGLCLVGTPHPAG